jgi:hypothetical protein
MTLAWLWKILQVRYLLLTVVAGAVKTGQTHERRSDIPGMIGDRAEIDGGDAAVEYRRWVGG